MANNAVACFFCVPLLAVLGCQPNFTVGLPRACRTGRALTYVGHVCIYFLSSARHGCTKHGVPLPLIHSLACTLWWCVCCPCRQPPATKGYTGLLLPLQCAVHLDRQPSQGSSVNKVTATFCCCCLPLMPRMVSGKCFKVELLEGGRG